MTTVFPSAAEGNGLCYAKAPAAEAGTHEIPALPFPDAEPGTELYDTLRYVYENRIMNGVSGEMFDPYPAYPLHIFSSFPALI